MSVMRRARRLILVVTVILAAFLVGGTASAAPPYVTSDGATGSVSDEASKESSKSSAEKRKPTKEQKAALKKSKKTLKKLSDDEREEFKDKAQEVILYSRSEADRALEDPGLFMSTPVKSELKIRRSAGRSSASSSDVTTQGSYCTDVTFSYTFTNWWGNLLWYYDLRQPWCYDYYEVTAYEPTVIGNVTGLGSYAWSYEGTVDLNQYYFRSGGSPYGGWYAYRQGAFVLAPLGEFEFQRVYPYHEAWVYYDGSFEGY